MDSDLLTQDTSTDLSSRLMRKVPNLKGLRDMIKKNSGHNPSSSTTLYHKGTPGDKIMRNDSECSFTLTDDEDRENADYNNQKKGSAQRGNILHHKRQTSKGRTSATDQKLNQDLLVGVQRMKDQPMNLNEIPKMPFQDVEEEVKDDEEDRFLKELEKENKLLEQELKILQSSTCSTNQMPAAAAPPQIIRQKIQQSRSLTQRGQLESKRPNLNHSHSVNGQSQIISQRRIRFQDEVLMDEVGGNTVHSENSQKKSITPRDHSIDPSFSQGQQNPLKTSIMSSGNKNSPQIIIKGANQNFSYQNMVKNKSNQIQRQRQSHSPQKSLNNDHLAQMSIQSQNFHTTSFCQDPLSNPYSHNQIIQSTTSSRNLNGNNQNTPSLGNPIIHQSVDLEKFKSLELRLMGCMRTIKTLERENQAKTDKISSLALELDKKSKIIETLNAEKQGSASSQQRMHIQSQISANQKKKERELEAKIKDQDSQIADLKKTLSRFQELNKQLIDKTKELELQLITLNPQQLDTKTILCQHHNDEISRLKKEVDKAKTETRQVRTNERQKCEYIERECTMLRERYESIKSQAIQFELASQQLYLSYIAINERIKGTQSQA